jgi:hypothetical protein
MSLTIENCPGLVPGLNIKGSMEEKTKIYRVAKDVESFMHGGKIVKPGDVLDPQPKGITLQEYKGRKLIEEVPEKTADKKVPEVPEKTADKKVPEVPEKAEDKKGK